MRSERLSILMDMLTYCRPHGSLTERFFIDRFIRPLPGAYCHEFGNWHVAVGESKVLWSCHTDTVHHAEGRQTLHYDDQSGLISLSHRAKKTSSCLGADDTAGIFLLTQMIAAHVPGHYIFHYGEEAGGIGSRALAEDYGEWLSTFDCAIALDRRGTQDIITHQGGRRTASDAFARSLSAALGLNHEPAQGIYTDTAEYAELIGECSNISVGYQHEHSKAETLDTRYLFYLADALCAFDASLLTFERNPDDDDDDYRTDGGFRYTWDPSDDSVTTIHNRWSSWQCLGCLQWNAADLSECVACGLSEADSLALDGCSLEQLYVKESVR